MYNILILFVVFNFISSCSFFNSSSEGYYNAKNQINAIVNSDYNEVISYFDVAKTDTLKTNKLKKGIPKIRTAIVENFGNDFDLSFSKSNKTFSFSTVKPDRPGPISIKIKLQIKNETHFGIIEVTINEENNKIQYIELLNYKEEIPSYIFLYLVGIIAISVAAINLKAINRIRKSNLRKKWLRIIGLLFFNVPTITFSALGHISINISSQVLLGLSFSSTGIDETMVAFGIPIGSILTLCTVRKNVP